MKPREPRLLRPNLHDDKILCADDYGFNSCVSEGILDLCRLNCLQATSVLVEATRNSTLAECLKEFSGSTQIGLHFNLTEDFGTAAFKLRSLMLAIRFSKNMQLDIAERLQNQLDMFDDQFGRQPDFIDGHQHVHVMPAVRPIFISVLTKRYMNSKKRPWIRQVSAPIFDTDSITKVLILKILNMGFRKNCMANGFTYNHSFYGVYSFKKEVPYHNYLETWIKKSNKGTLIMCHPGRNICTDDPIGIAREKEYRTIMSMQ
jgi:predicted glycoside hydrolase/deacetylase ChbG (UPF0249 family)